MVTYNLRFRVWGRFRGFMVTYNPNDESTHSLLRGLWGLRRLRSTVGIWVISALSFQVKAPRSKVGSVGPFCGPLDFIIFLLLLHCFISGLCFGIIFNFPASLPGNLLIKKFQRV